MKQDFSKHIMESGRGKKVSNYLVVKFETLLNVYLGKCESENGCMLDYFSSNGVKSRWGRREERCLLESKS